MSRRPLNTVLLLSLLWLSAACTSRYRLELFMGIEGEQTRVRIESARFVPNTRLGTPFSDRKLLPGETATVLVRMSVRGATLPHALLSNALQFDENLQSDLYLELDQPPAAGSWPLANRSFVQVLGRFDRPLEEKIFMPDDFGSATLDSVTTKYLFISVRGTYVSQAGQHLNLTGSVRVDRTAP